MRSKSKVELALKCIYAYRDYLITKEHINKNIFKHFRLHQLAGFIYGVHYCLGSFDDINSSMDLINIFPASVHTCYENHLNEIMNIKGKELYNE